MAAIDSEQAMISFLSKDTSQVYKADSKTVYAVDIDSELTNPVEKAFKVRDIGKEKGLIKLILQEAEHKVHLKDGTLPKQTFIVDSNQNGAWIVDQKGQLIDDDHWAATTSIIRNNYDASILKNSASDIEADISKSHQNF